MKIVIRGVFTPPGYIHIHNNQFKVSPYHETPQITCNHLESGPALFWLTQFDSRLLFIRLGSIKK